MENRAKALLDELSGEAGLIRGSFDYKEAQPIIDRYLAEIEAAHKHALVTVIEGYEKQEAELIEKLAKGLVGKTVRRLELEVEMDDGTYEQLDAIRDPAQWARVEHFLTAAMKSIAKEDE